MVEDEQTQVKSIGKPAPEKLINSSRDSPSRTLYLLHKQAKGVESLRGNCLQTQAR
jgi:hypothetical protein